MEIDNVDYALLTCLEDAEGGVWKKKLHDALQQRVTEFPGDVAKSIQTVGRRVEDLHDAAYVTSCIVRPEDLPRDLIIAYELTEEGRDALREKRSVLLKRYAAAYHGVVDDDLHEQPNANKVIAHLLCRQHNLSQDRCTALAEWSVPPLIALAHLFAFHEILEEDVREEDLAAEVTSFVEDMNGAPPAFAALM